MLSKRNVITDIRISIQGRRLHCPMQSCTALKFQLLKIWVYWPYKLNLKVYKNIMKIPIHNQTLTRSPHHPIITSQHHYITPSPFLQLHSSCLQLPSYDLHLYSYHLHGCSYDLHLCSYRLHFHPYRLQFNPYRLQAYPFPSQIAKSLTLWL